jgi:hypothetical protein
MKNLVFYSAEFLWINYYNVNRNKEFTYEFVVRPYYIYVYILYILLRNNK